MPQKSPQILNTATPKTSLDKTKQTFPKPVKTKTGLNAKGGTFMQESEKLTSLQVPNTANGKPKLKGKERSMSKKDLSSHNVGSDKSDRGSVKNSNWRDFFASEEIQMGLEEVKK